MEISLIELEKFLGTQLDSQGEIEKILAQARTMSRDGISVSEEDLPNILGEELDFEYARQKLLELIA